MQTGKGRDSEHKINDRVPNLKMYIIVNSIC